MVKLYFAFAFVLFSSAAAAQQSRYVTDIKTNKSRSIVQAGRLIARQNCQTCHAVGRTGTSANPKSPPLRTLSQKYPIDTLSEAFAEGILVGHSSMPEFQLEPEQINALLAYIKSIQVPARSGVRKTTSR